MRIMLKTVLCLCLYSFFSTTVEAKEWRGIIPMQSTRADVTRILGKSRDANHIRANYNLDEGHIYIVFASTDAYYDCVKKLPIDTVLLIQFTPTPGFRLADLKLDLSKFRKFDPSEPKNIGYEGYVDEEEGLIIATYKGEVDKIEYIPTVKDRKLCPEYYNNPEKFVRIVVG